MINIGKFILIDGTISDALPEAGEALGVVFDETQDAYLILPFTDIDSQQSYSIQEIIDIAECYNQKHGNRWLQWIVPTLRDWNVIINRLGKALPIGKEGPCSLVRKAEWTEFDAAIAQENLKGFGLSADLSYWSSTEYDDDVYLLDLAAGTIEAYPMWDDGEPYDYALRLIGKVSKNKNL